MRPVTRHAGPPGVVLEDDAEVVAADDAHRNFRRYVPSVDKMRLLFARARELDPARADALLAAALALAVTLEVVVGQVGDSVPASIVYGLATTVPIAWRRRAPLAVIIVILAAFIVAELIDDSWADHVGTPVVAIVLAMYSVGAHIEGRRLVGASIVAVAGLCAAILADPGHDPSDFAFAGLVFAVAPILAGRAVGNRLLLAEALQDKARRLELERAERENAAVADERSRIARELHDVVAHALSVMVIQAGAARRMLASDPAVAGESFASIEGTGREALGEMRRLLGVLRREDEEVALTPQPGLEGLDDLLARCAAAGMRVDLRVEGEPDGLPTGVQLIVYRVIQEALTRALAESAARHASVLLRAAPGDLEVEVRDDGRAGVDGDALAALRERVAFYGGELRAGPADKGEFAVRVRLPVAGAVT